MTRSLRHYHMGCGENLSSSSWLMLMQKTTKLNVKMTDNRLVTTTRQKKKS